ncbi:MAG: hypothetical protein B7Y95_05975 [Rhizobiales bacterium 32-66-11]|jgi:type VI protein secretion system component VasF|nr:MAG: hypothetical protein B7Y95_05975 [Rhizobiales bacterium 32-66-11]
MATRRPELDALKAELAAQAPAAPAAHAARSRAKPAAASPPEAAPHETLQAQAAPPNEDAPQPGTGEAPEPSLSELQALVRDLQAAVTDAKAQADATVSAHPAVSVASAFLLGVLVGRAWGRSS